MFTGLQCTISWYKGQYHLVVRAPVPYDRISPVRIPPLLSGAALTLHPASLQYISSFSLGLFKHMIFTPNILCESDFCLWGQVGFQLTKLTYKSRVSAEIMKPEVKLNKSNIK